MILPIMNTVGVYYKIIYFSYTNRVLWHRPTSDVLGGISQPFRILGLPKRNKTLSRVEGKRFF